MGPMHYIVNAFAGVFQSSRSGDEIFFKSPWFRTRKTWKTCPCHQKMSIHGEYCAYTVHTYHLYSFIFVYPKSKLMCLYRVYVSFLPKIQIILRLQVEARQFQKLGEWTFTSPSHCFKSLAMKPRRKNLRLLGRKRPNLRNYIESHPFQSTESADRHEHPTKNPHGWNRSVLTSRRSKKFKLTGAAVLFAETHAGFASNVYKNGNQLRKIHPVRWFPSYQPRWFCPVPWASDHPSSPSSGFFRVLRLAKMLVRLCQV